MVQKFPTTRLRRNRYDDATRRLVAEHKLSTDDLIWPIFIKSGTGAPEPINAMPGVSRTTLENLPRHVELAATLKIPAIGLVGDVALDPYTNHGHDGVLRDGYVANDETLEILVKQAVNQANAGVDIIAPSDMMDGRIAALRAGLDASGHIHTRLMSYAAKYASAFYGPFRDAIGSGGALKGDKKTYQMNPANAEEALHEVAMDIDEGADMIMVKPGMPYLDIIHRVKQRFQVPVFAYQVSGEYSMIMAAVNNGWMDHDRAVLESLLSFKRAGCSGILTYFAVTAARLLQTS